MEKLNELFWSMKKEDIFSALDTSEEGLTNGDAAERIRKNRQNSYGTKKNNGVVKLLLAQYKSPIIIILIFATGLSYIFHDTSDAVIIMTIVILSGLLSFWQEYGANDAVSKLLKTVKTNVVVLRDRSPQEVGVDEVVPGDVVILRAGAVVPADCIIIESDSLNVDESTLTGETFPVEKQAEILSADTPMNNRINSLWMGTHVISGTAKALVVMTGKDTEFGKISERLKLTPDETDFEKGIRKFGYFLMEVTLILVIVIFALNVFFKRPVLDSFMFSLALAVGLTPQLLPAIISINLAHGAKTMAGKKVIVKKLASIENFGSMDVLCSDKTGTLTDGSVKIHAAVDANGNPSEKVFLYAYINAYFESGYINPIDEAIRQHRSIDMKDYIKLDEHPYDFIRKRLSIMVVNTSENQDNNFMVSKGALKNILDVCTKAETENGSIVDINQVYTDIENRFKEFSQKGYRTLGIAYKNISKRSTIEDELESDMIFLGFITLFDPLKENIAATIGSLKDYGVSLKIITGDNRLIAENIVSQMGYSNMKILTGSEIHAMSDGALMKRVGETSVFAEVEPNQKERIIIALKKSGSIVGYMGDGINDVSALHAADVSISVDSAVDVAKEAADIVLMEKNLEVLVDGIKAGRITFANTIKYVFMATSANFGNMFSMAGASIFLPFLPLLPKQILVTNLLTDLPEMTIATDSVDDEMIMSPKRWDIDFIRKFMLTFGFISSVFDFITFIVLRYVVFASEAQFRAGWFIESVVSAAFIVMVIRTRQPFYKSTPGKYLLITTICTAAASVIIALTPPLEKLLGFEAVDAWVLAAIAAIIIVYIFTAEAAKRVFYKITDKPKR